MTATAGQRVSTQSLLLDGIDSQRIFGYDGMIANLVKDQAPFITFINKLSRKGISDPDYKYNEYRGSWLTRPGVYLGTAIAMTSSAAGKLFTNVQLYDNAATGGGEQTANAAAWVTPGKMIQLVSRSSGAEEINKTATFYVKAPTSAGAGKFNLVLLTASPGWAGVDTTGDARTAVYVIGDMFGEGGAAATAYYEGVIASWASAEISKMRFDISNTVKKLVAAGNFKEADFLYRISLEKLKAELERKMLYASSRFGGTGTNPYGYAAIGYDSDDGDPGLADANGKLIRTSISMKQACTDAVNRGMLETRVFKFNSSSTYSTILTNMMNQFKFGSAEKYGFIGDGALNALKTLVNATTYRGALNINATTWDQAFDLPVMKLETDFGTINLIRDRTLTQDSAYTNTMFVVDPANVDFLVYRDIELADLPTTDDAECKEFRTEVGLCVKLPETHGFWYVGA